MARISKIGEAALTARTALTLGRGTWRMRSGRLPWHARKPARRRRPFSRR
jgi:hypothetical protein